MALGCWPLPGNSRAELPRCGWIQGPGSLVTTGRLPSLCSRLKVRCPDRQQVLRAVVPRGVRLAAFPLWGLHGPPAQVTLQRSVRTLKDTPPSVPCSSSSTLGLLFISQWVHFCPPWSLLGTHAHTHTRVHVCEQTHRWRADRARLSSLLFTCTPQSAGTQDDLNNQCVDQWHPYGEDRKVLF